MWILLRQLRPILKIGLDLARNEGKDRSKSKKRTAMRTRSMSAKGRAKSQSVVFGDARLSRLKDWSIGEHPLQPKLWSNRTMFTRNFTITMAKNGSYDQATPLLDLTTRSPRRTCRRPLVLHPLHQLFSHPPHLLSPRRIINTRLDRQRATLSTRGGIDYERQLALVSGTLASSTATSHFRPTITPTFPPKSCPNPSPSQASATNHQSFLETRVQEHERLLPLGRTRCSLRPSKTSV